MRVFAVSDIHIDFPENRQWLQQLSDWDYQDDVLILAGDISDVSEHLQNCFRWLSKKFYKVAFVPGNHDLWSYRTELKDSLEKHSFIEQLAADFGVATEGLYWDHLAIVGLQGWYDYSFGEPCEKLLDIWADYHACEWPQNYDTRTIADHFLAKNPKALEQAAPMLITFSHFLPRIDLMPSYIPAKHRIIYPVLGCNRLDQQLRQLGSKLHIYGHSHVNRDRTIDGIRYINNAFGYPRETRITQKRLQKVYAA